MRWLIQIAVLVVVASGWLPAQVHGGRAAGGVVFANPSGYGNVAFPGTGRPVTGATGFGAAGFGTAGVPSVGAGRQLPYRGNNGFNHRTNGIGSYGYPVLVGGYGFDNGYGNGYGEASGYPQQQQPNITIINNPAPVVINQNFGPPPEQVPQETTHVFQPPATYPTEDTAPAPHYFLIAYKDHSVYSALAYWVEDKTMHYVTPQQTHNQASLDLIDLDFTKKLNQR